MKKTRFPLTLFLLYVAFFSAQAIYGVYLNPYLASIGFSQTQIGLTVTVSTAVLLVFQPLWGLLSDRAKHKNTILFILLAASAVLSLSFYLSHSYWVIVGLVGVFSIFYNAIVPLQDNLNLEYLEDKPWSFGQVRMGGTLGYAFMVAIAGFLLKGKYDSIFVVMSLLLALGAVVLLFAPKVPGYRRGEKKHAPIRQIFRDRTMLCMLAFCLFFSLGFNIFYSFYPVYYTSIGGTSAQVGLMMFISAMGEVPFLLFANKLIGRIGLLRTMMLSGVATSLRWLLLFVLTDPAWVIGVNILHGLGFVSVNYCVAVYINENFPKELRATGQTVNALTMTFFSRVVFGYLGGLGCDLFGTNNMLLFSGILTLAAVLLFALWYRFLYKKPSPAASPETSA